MEELRKVQNQDTGNARVSYYLGQAVRALVEKETLEEASKALQVYIDKGAPLFHREEIMEFLKSRKT